MPTRNIPIHKITYLLQSRDDLQLAFLKVLADVARKHRDKYGDPDFKSMCWIWTGLTVRNVAAISIDVTGVPRAGDEIPGNITGDARTAIRVNSSRRPRRAITAVHRLVYFLLVDPEAEDVGQHVVQTCGNSRCVNKIHINLRTTARVIRADYLAEISGISPDIISAPACRRGHPITESSSKILSNGSRFCRICYNERMRLYRKRKATSIDTTTDTPTTDTTADA
jgi:hypothetical protein